MPSAVLPPGGSPLPPVGGHATLPPGAPVPGGPQTIPAGGNPGVTAPGPQPPFAWGPPGTVIPLPDGGSITVPQQGFTPEQFNALSGIRAGNAVGGPFAQQIVNQLIGEGFLSPGSGSMYGTPAGQAPPPGSSPPGVPRPGGAPQSGPVYTQGRVTQDQFNQQAAQSAYRPMSAADRWARLAASQAPPAAPAPAPPPGPVQIPPIASTPYEPPPTWGGKPGGPPMNGPPFNPNQSPGDEYNGPRPAGPPGQTLPGSGGGQTTTTKPGKPKPQGGFPPFYPNPKDAHAKALRTVLG